MISRRPILHLKTDVVISGVRILQEKSDATITGVRILQEESDAAITGVRILQERRVHRNPDDTISKDFDTWHNQFRRLE